MEANIWCDGSAGKKAATGRVKRGPAGAGYVVMLSDGTREARSDPLGRRTNNEAEYEAVLRALTLGLELGATHAHVYSDSRTVVGQVAWGWACNYPHLRALRAKIFRLVRRYPEGVAFVNIPRNENGDADKLAKEATEASKLQ